MFKLSVMITKVSEKQIHVIAHACIRMQYNKNHQFYVNWQAENLYFSWKEIWSFLFMIVVLEGLAHLPGLRWW